VQTKESYQDERPSPGAHKDKDSLIPGFVTAGGSEQSPPAPRLRSLYCAAFVSPSEKGEFIPTTAQKHTYFIAVSLSGNIFSNHLPMRFVQRLEGNMLNEIKK